MSGADWNPGDQAMCVRALPRGPITPTFKPSHFPSPPLIYDVVAVWTGKGLARASGFPSFVLEPFWLELDGVYNIPTGLNFRVAASYFRKLKPLPPEDEEISERVEEPA